MTDHPVAPEQRTVDVDVTDLDTRGRMVTGYASVYGAESRGLEWTETVAPGAFSDVLDADVRCLLNHDPSQVLGRTRAGTLRLFDEARGLRFECDLPESPLGENVRQAVKRGDVDGASFRFAVGEDEWPDGEHRTIKKVKALHDVTVATYGAYPDASVELRTRPQPKEEATVPPETTTAGGLHLEDRSAADDTPSVETRVIEALRRVPKGEARDLSTASVANVSPPELSSYLFDKLRPASIALSTGIQVLSTDREAVVWPKLVSDVSPSFVPELGLIPEGDPGFANLTARPKKIAHRTVVSNEVIDDSIPSITDVLSAHLGRMLALKLDLALFEGDPGTDPNAIQGIKNTPGIQTIAMGTNGALFTDLDPFASALGLLAAVNAPPPYVIVMSPAAWTALSKLKEGGGFNRPLLEAFPTDSAPARIYGAPVFVTSQLSTTESQGTSSTTSSAYVYSPSQVVLIRRQDATIALDRSRLFDHDASEMRGILRADLLVPNAEAVVRITGIKTA
jgi:HK97 family phage major capsid protein